MNHAVLYLRFLWRRFVEDRCLMVAGSLTFTTLLALVPLFTVTITLTSQIAFTRDLVLQVKFFLVKTLVPEVAGKVIGVYMEQFAQNTAKLTYIGLTIVLITAVAMMFTIDDAFNAIWRAKRKRSLVMRALGYLAVLTVGPLLVGAGLTMTRSMIHWTHRFEEVVPLFDDWLLLLVPIALTTGALVLAYRVIPRRHVPFRHALFGAVIAAICFEVMKLLFVSYVARVANYGLVYGAFSSVPIFLLWLFCCWLVVLVGAEVAATLSYLRHPSAHSTPVQGEVEGRMLAIIEASPVPLSQNQIRHQLQLPIDATEDAVAALLSQGLIDSVQEKGRPLYGRIAPAAEIS